MEACLDLTLTDGFRAWFNTLLVYLLNDSMAFAKSYLLSPWQPLRSLSLTINMFLKGVLIWHYDEGTEMRSIIWFFFTTPQGVLGCLIHIRRKTPGQGCNNLQVLELEWKLRKTWKAETLTSWHFQEGQRDYNFNRRGPHEQFDFSKYLL